jgi:hypothetical protein
MGTLIHLLKYWISYLQKIAKLEENTKCYTKIYTLKVETIVNYVVFKLIIPKRRKILIY